MFMVNEELLKEEIGMVNNAFDSATSLLKPDKNCID